MLAEVFEGVTDSVGKLIGVLVDVGERVAEGVLVNLRASSPRCTPQLFHEMERIGDAIVLMGECHENGIAGLRNLVDAFVGSVLVFQLVA